MDNRFFDSLKCLALFKLRFFTMDSNVHFKQIYRLFSFFHCVNAIAHRLWISRQMYIVRIVYSVFDTPAYIIFDISYNLTEK